MRRAAYQIVASKTFIVLQVSSCWQLVYSLVQRSTTDCCEEASYILVYFYCVCRVCGGYVCVGEYVHFREKNSKGLGAFL